MKINEVETLVGITKKNIRFYEKEGLLAPGRDSGNGYRNYDEKDVAALKQVKLLRKLGVPLEEIRRMQGGTLTVSDGMARHRILLERERRSMEQAAVLCGELKECGETFAALDADRYLARMEVMEEEGTNFMNKQEGDVRRKKYVGAAIAAIVMMVFMAAMIWLFAWAQAEEPMPLPLLGFLMLIPGAMIVGTILALAQRVKEIKGGEEDAARQY